MSDYEIWHDEYKGDYTNNEYWHGIFFLPVEKRSEVIRLLNDIKSEYKINKNKVVKFAGSLSDPNNRTSQIVSNNLNLFNHLLITKEAKAKTSIFHISKKKVYENNYSPFLSIQGVFGCKFVLFFIPDNHQSFTKYSMNYAKRVETTFRMGFKGGSHLLFSKHNHINIVKFYFDGNKHHGRHIDIDRITKGFFKSNFNIDENCIIDDRQMAERDNDSKILMTFVDNIIGAWSAKLKFKNDPGNILFPLTDLYKRLLNNKIIKNPYSRWYRSMSVSKLMIENDQICFPDFFENEYQLKLFC